MAYICADCRLYFSRTSTNCPRCGRRPVNDGHSEAELEALGYRLLALPDLSNRSARRSVIHDDDILAGLRRDYERQQASSRRPAEAEPSPPPPEEDFFAGLRRESTGTGPTPPDRPRPTRTPGSPDPRPLGSPLPRLARVSPAPPPGGPVLPPEPRCRHPLAAAAAHRLRGPGHRPCWQPYGPCAGPWCRGCCPSSPPCSPAL